MNRRLFSSPDSPTPPRNNRTPSPPRFNPISPSTSPVHGTPPPNNVYGTPPPNNRYGTPPPIERYNVGYGNPFLNRTPRYTPSPLIFNPISPGNSPGTPSHIYEQSFKHIPSDVQLYDPITMDEENLHKFLKKKDNLVFIFGNNYYPLSKETIRMQMKDPLNIVFECFNPDVPFLRYLPDGSIEPNENVNKKVKYLRLNSLAIPGDFIYLKRIQSILLDTHQIYNMVETDKVLVTVVSDNVLNNQGSYVSASHCQSGQGGKVYDLNKKIIRAYSKRSRKNILSITKKNKGYFSKSKSSKIKSSLLKKKSTNSKSKKSNK